MRPLFSFKRCSYFVISIDLLRQRHSFDSELCNFLSANHIHVIQSTQKHEKPKTRGPIGLEMGCKDEKAKCEPNTLLESNRVLGGCIRPGLLG